MVDSMFMDSEKCKKAPSCSSEFTLPCHVHVFNFEAVFYFLDVISFMVTVKFHLPSTDEWKTTNVRQISYLSRVSQSIAGFKGMAHNI